MRSQPGGIAPDYMKHDNSFAHNLALHCRNCSGFSTATITFSRSDAVNMGSGSSYTDITKYVENVWYQSPKTDSDISDNVPQVVADVLRDAYEANRPRAKCSHFRTAVEFAIRNVGLKAKPSEPLGAILSRAKKDNAISPALIELCDQVKAFGNWGLHWSETDVDEEDALAAKQITEAILLYLFEMPAMVQAAKQRTDEAKANHKESDET